MIFRCEVWNLSVYISYTISSFCKVCLPSTQPTWHIGGLTGNFQLADCVSHKSAPFTFLLPPSFLLLPIYTFPYVQYLTQPSQDPTVPTPFLFFSSHHPWKFHELDVKETIIFYPIPEALWNYQFHRILIEA